MAETPNLPPAADDQANTELEDKARFRARRARARRVLLGAFLFIVVGSVIYGVWPWLLPAFIYEGPMVQMAGEHEVTLVWYMTRPVSDGLSVQIKDKGGEVFGVDSSNRRCRAHLTGLDAGQTYAYTISLGQRALAQDALRTNKPAGQPFTFIAFGDSGKGTESQYLLAAQMPAINPDFVLHTGDLIYNCGERFLYRSRFFRPYRALLSRVNFWPSIGNHDVTEPIDESAYFDVFDLPRNGPPELSPEHNYWFDYASARIAIVDSELDEATLGESVAPWLRDVFAKSDALWKFVVFHRPPYTAGRHGPCEKVQHTLVPVFEQAGVDMVFNGHDHMYERTTPIRDGKPAEDGRGVVYIVTGAGGARLYDVLPPEKRPAYIASVHNEIHSLTKVTVTGDELTLEQIAQGGAMLDHWTLHKSPAPAGQP